MIFWIGNAYDFLDERDNYHHNFIINAAFWFACRVSSSITRKVLKKQTELNIYYIINSYIKLLYLFIENCIIGQQKYRCFCLWIYIIIAYRQKSFNALSFMCWESNITSIILIKQNWNENIFYGKNNHGL